MLIAMEASRKTPTKRSRLSSDVCVEIRNLSATLTHMLLSPDSFVNQGQKMLEVTGKEKDKYKEVCLVDAIRAHGIKAVYDRHGPLWALKDGGPMLHEHGLLVETTAAKALPLCVQKVYTTYRLPLILVRYRIFREPGWQSLRRSGIFIVAYDAHFVAVRKSTENALEVNFSHRRHLWHPLLLADEGHSGREPFAFCDVARKWSLDITRCQGLFRIVSAHDDGLDFFEAADELGGRSNDEQDASGGSGTKPADDSKLDARGGGSHCCAFLGGMPTSAAAALPGYLGLTSTVRLFASVPKQHRYDSIRNTLKDWLCSIRDVQTSETAQKTAQQKSLTSGRKILNGITSSALLAARNGFGVGSVIDRLEDVDALYPGLFGTTTAGVCFMTAQRTKFTVDFLKATVGLPNDAESVSLADYLAWSSPSTDDFLQAWLMMNYGRDDEECVRDVTSLLRRGAWSYLYFPAADNGRPAVLFLLFIVHDMMGCIAAVDSIVDPTCDFRGGASDQREIPQTHISAKDFWLELQAGHTDGEQDKWHQTVRGILLSHPESLADLPHLVDLLPDPRERAAMSKRRWEKLLCRSRVFLDMFEEKRYALLFQYMHAEAKKLAQDNKSFLSNIPHPEEIASSDRQQWRWDVSLAVVRLQLLLARMERERAAQDTRDTSASSPPAAASTDAFGGSDSINFAQRKRLQSSWLDACRRKAARLASPNNGLLPVLHWPTTFTFPCSPDSFDAGAAPDVDVLKLLRAHPRDSRIRFQASDHTYYIGGVQTKGSVTGVIHTFCTPFEADSVITNMMNGARWPRAGYLKHEVSFTNISRLSALCPVLLDLYAGSPRNDARISGLLQELARNHDIEDELLQLTLSREEIKAMWAAAGQEAAHYGTYMHYIFEAFLNGHHVPTSSPEVRMLRNFLCSLARGTTAWRTEWTIYGEEEQLAGSIDFCARLADGSLMLVDWKRASGLQSKYSSPQCMRPPLSHMADCTGVHYRLQLNVYRHLLEKYYNVKVSCMFVVCCHPEHDPFAFIDRVPRLERETEEMLRVWRGSHESQNLSSTGSLQSVNDVCGGKQVETCAADQIAELTSHEDFLMVASPLAHPVPLRPLPDQFVPVMHDEDDSDDSEAGFWDSRCDWYERAQSHLQVRAEHISLDVLGGACAVTLHGDLMWLLPRFFDEYGDLRTLAKCNRELRNIILTKKYWWGAHVSLCVGELADNPVALRNAVSLFEEAAARTLDLCQIPCLNAMADRVLVNWLAQQLRLPGNDVQGWVSTHPLLGAVRFGLKLPRATRSIYIGALDAGRSGIRSYIWIKDPYGLCEVWLGISGRLATGMFSY